MTTDLGSGFIFRTRRLSRCKLPICRCVLNEHIALQCTSSLFNLAKYSRLYDDFYNFSMPPAPYGSFDTEYNSQCLIYKHFSDSQTIVAPIKRRLPPFEAQCRAVCLKMGGRNQSACPSLQRLTSSLNILLKTPFFDQRTKRL